MLTICLPHFPPQLFHIKFPPFLKKNLSQEFLHSTFCQFLTTFTFIFICSQLFASKCSYPRDFLHSPPRNCYGIMANNGRSKTLISTVLKMISYSSPFLEYVWMKIIWNISTKYYIHPTPPLLQFSKAMFENLSQIENGHIFTNKSVKKNLKALSWTNIKGLRKQSAFILLIFVHLAEIWTIFVFLS